MLYTKNIHISEITQLSDVGRALSSPERLEILNVLNLKPCNISELSRMLKQPISSVTRNIDILEEVGLISSTISYSETGRKRLCVRSCDKVNIDLFLPVQQVSQQAIISLPLGNYSSYEVEAPCGMATELHTIGQDNDPNNFFSMERLQAQLLWFTSGFVEYRISEKQLPKQMKELEITFEACSEAPFYRNDWKSDITVWINDTEIGTWTSLGDFGGRRGLQNPDWWLDCMSQYGILTSWKITEEGTFINNNQISNKNLASYKIRMDRYISLKIGIKKDARYVGGLNLFGKSFGDYNQDIFIIMRW